MTGPETMKLIPTDARSFWPILKSSEAIEVQAAHSNDRSFVLNLSSTWSTNCTQLIFYLIDKLHISHVFLSRLQLCGCCQTIYRLWSFKIQSSHGFNGLVYEIVSVILVWMNTGLVPNSLPLYLHSYLHSSMVSSQTNPVYRAHSIWRGSSNTMGMHNRPHLYADVMQIYGCCNFEAMSYVAPRFAVCSGDI